MDQCRALKRIFLIPYILKRFNKSEGTRLKLSTLNLLIAVYKIPGTSGCTKQAISDMLSENLRTQSPNTIADGLNYLIGLGYIREKQHCWPHKYNITMEGKNALLELETRLRQARLPRPK